MPPFIVEEDEDVVDISDLYKYLDDITALVDISDLYSYIKNTNKLEPIPEYMYRILKSKFMQKTFTETIKKMLLTLENNNVHIVDVEATHDTVKLFVHLKMLGLRIYNSDTIYYFEKPIEQLCRISVTRSSTYVYAVCSKIRPANVNPEGGALCLGNLAIDVVFTPPTIYRAFLNAISVLMIPNIDNDYWASKFYTFIKYSEDVKFKGYNKEDVIKKIEDKVPVYDVDVKKVNIADVCGNNQNCRKYLEEHAELLLQKEIIVKKEDDPDDDDFEETDDEYTDDDDYQEDFYDDAQEDFDE